MSFLLSQIAEGVRDRIYGPVIRAQDEVQHLEEQRRREEQEAARGPRSCARERHTSDSGVRNKSQYSADTERPLRATPCSTSRISTRVNGGACSSGWNENSRKSSPVRSRSATWRRVNEILDEELGDAETDDEDEGDDDYEDEDDDNDDEDNDDEE